MARYLVTGGTGFIGSALVRALLAQGHSVRSFDNDSRGSRASLSGVEAQVDLMVGDIRDLRSVEKAVEGVDSVCHLAAINGTKNFYSRPADVLEVATKGILNIVDACRSKSVRELVVMSSSEVYQLAPIVPTPEAVPLIIPDPKNPRYSYAGGKLISELIALNTSDSDFDKVLIVRPHNVYGPRMGWEHVIPEFFMKIVTAMMTDMGKPVELPIQGNGAETRAFVYIDDFIQGFLKILAHGKTKEIYHLGTSDEVSILGLIEKIGTVMGTPIRPIAGPLTQGSTARRCPDITKARKLGYTPKISLEEGLKRTWSWYRDNMQLAPNREKSCQTQASTQAI